MHVTQAQGHWIKKPRQITLLNWLSMTVRATLDVHRITMFKACHCTSSQVNISSKQVMKPQQAGSRRNTVTSKQEADNWHN